MSTRGRNIIGVLILILIILIPTLSFCEEGSNARENPNGEESSNVFTLGEIELIDKADKSKNVTVEKIDSDEMRELTKKDVAQAVNILPGVTLSTVGPRKESTIFIRGFDIKHAPLFLDGIPIYVPYDGYPDLGRFSTFDLSELVVSRGLVSVLYGPDTMGGAINMVSRKPERKFEGDAGAGYATGKTYDTFFNVGTNQGLWYLQAAAYYLDSDHTVLSDHFTPKNSFQGKGDRVNSYETDKKYSLKIGLTPGKDEYALAYSYYDSQRGAPPYTGTDPTSPVRFFQWPYWAKDSVYLTTRTALGESSYVKTRLYWDKYANSLYSFDNATYSTITKPFAFRSWYNDHRIGGSVEAGTRIIPHNDLKVSAHYWRDYHEQFNAGQPVQKFEDHIFSLGAEDTIDFTNRLYAIAGVSYDSIKTVQAQNLVGTTLVDFPKDSASACNPQLGVFYKLTDTGTAYASVARKSRLPSIKDKYSFRLGTALPNPFLKPERSTNYELGYRDVLLDRFTVKADVFYNDISDFIILAVAPSDPTKTQNQNISKVQQYGAELEFSGRILSSLEGGANYTYIYRSNRSTGDKLTGVPKHKVYAYAKYSPLEKVSFVADAEYDTMRFSNTTGSRIAGPFTVANAKVVVSPLKNLEIEAGAKNVFDKNYALEEGFPEPGRTFFSNVYYKF